MTGMLVIRDAESFRSHCRGLRERGHSVGVVPTMGALHRGHVSLMKEAQRRAERVVVTIFVNPTQFGPGEDFARYPRDLDADVAVCNAEGVAAVFAPEVAEMYPAGDSTRVTVHGLSEGLCGATRPGHFEGVATIVSKLLALTGECVAVFGRKDYQQLKIIERLVRDLWLPTAVIGCPIVRDPDGLALSSRNRYLSRDQRTRALEIPRALSWAGERFAAGLRDPEALRQGVATRLGQAGLEPEYVSLVDPQTLVPVGPGAEQMLLAVAARVGSTRLIDNVELGGDPAPPSAG